jgi:hypothetical protein
MLLLLGYRFLYPGTAFGTEDRASAQSSLTFRAEKPNSRLEMLDSDCALLKVDVLRFQAQCLANAAAQPEEQSNQQSVAEIGGGILQTLHFTGFQISFCHHFVAILVIFIRFLRKLCVRAIVAFGHFAISLTR